MVSYQRLWETMRQKNISQYRLIKYYEISAGQIGRLKKNMYVSTHTIEVLCTILDCPVEHIMEIIPDPSLVEWRDRLQEEQLAKLAAQNPKRLTTSETADEQQRIPE